MDCYIVRVYRHVTRKNGQADEIAGLVERVGSQDNGQPFSTYTGLMEAIRESFDSPADSDLEGEARGSDGLRMIKTVRGR